MLLSRLSCENFRLFSSMDITFEKGLQAVIGPNGSGKSSVLEAITYAATGRSFRTSRPLHMVHHSSDCFRIWLDLPDDRCLALEKSMSGRVVLRDNGDRVSSQSQFARLLPLIFIDTHTHRLFAEDAKHRRSLIDWMMFHVKHTVYDAWQSYQKALKQRNECLKSGGRDLDTWDELLSHYAEIVDLERQQIFTEWCSIFKSMEVPFRWDGDLGYKRGWPEGITLLDCLRSNRYEDQRRGFTTKGAHRFDIIVQEQEMMAYHVLSQGQQKILNGLMRVAAAEYVHAKIQQSALWLVDDLPAELDQCRQNSWLKQLKQHSNQIIVTCLPEVNIDMPVAASLQEVAV